MTKKAEAATRKLEFGSMRRKLFAREYIRTGKQRDAAIAAGYAPGSADVQGSRLMKSPIVIAEVQRLETLRDAEEKIDRMYVLKGLYDMAEEADKDSDKIRALEPTNIAQQVFGFLVYLFAPKFSVSVRYATVRPCYLVTVAGRLKYAC